MTEYQRPINKIVISHLGDTSLIQGIARAIREPNLEKLEYHFGIGDYNGLDIPGISLARQEPSKRGHGDDSIGILFYGDLNKRSPTKPEVIALERILPYIVDRFGIHPEEVYTSGELTENFNDIEGLHINKIRHELSLRYEKREANIRRRRLRGMGA
ncbi:hypothetical protein COU60_01930 [Candidatus Pacearchaeota archaeon CG10_big_fil_rev_8_21_14_0_10_34_76]|nr:MAG: hypothetical protein COU60_01930 [Candidatus Pacearchaeota archaeon CG10_big_fil_rev_8_21_14_0_10_34_76]